MLESRSFSRRSFGIASVLSGLSGCGFGRSPLFDLLPGKSDGILRILTPWGPGLRSRFSEAFAKWSTHEGFAAVPIKWLPVHDSELATASIRQLLRSADVLLGGRIDTADVSESGEWALANLKPIRLPVLRLSNPTETREPAPDAAVPAVDDIARNIRSGRIRAGEVTLALSDQPGDPLTLAYFAGIFEDAPDQASGYARWVRLVGNSTKLAENSSERQVRLDLSDRAMVDRKIVLPWSGGEGTARALGIPETSEPAFWPENAIWRIDSKKAATIRLLMDFCLRDGWALSVGPVIPNEMPRNEFRTMMAEILRISCGDQVRNAWNAMLAAPGDRSAEVESYLATRPPWPPASVIETRTKRGFEYVVSLAEQLAVDQNQRDWLIQEFGKPESESDFRMLETADNGRLGGSARFGNWLNAEWTAWIRQRCRRAERYSKFGGSARLSADVSERKGT